MNTGSIASRRRFLSAISTFVLKSSGYAYSLQTRNLLIFYKARTASSADWRTPHEYSAIRIAISIPHRYFHIFVEIFYTVAHFAAA